MDGYESYPERLIRQAIERGEFDHLAGSGRPLAGLDDDPAWWAKAFIERQRRLDAAHKVSRRVEAELGGLWVLATEAEVVAAVEDLNRRLEDAGNPLPEADRPDLIDQAAVVETWRRLASGRRKRAIHR